MDREKEMELRVAEGGSVSGYEKKEDGCGHGHEPAWLLPATGSYDFTRSEILG